MHSKDENFACFFQDPELKKKKFEFKFKPYICEDYYGSLCFEAEITGGLRSILTSKIDLGSHTKLYFGLLPNGTLGMVYSVVIKITFHDRKTHAIIFIIYNYLCIRRYHKE